MEPTYIKTYEQFTCDKANLIDGDLIVHKDGNTYIVKISRDGYFNYFLKEE